MKKRELVESIARRAEGNPQEADRYLTATLETIAEALARGESVPLPGFGSFSVVEREARYVRDPRNGEERLVPEGRRVKFKPGSRLKSLVY